MDRGGLYIGRSECKSEHFVRMEPMQFSISFIKEHRTRSGTVANYKNWNGPMHFWRIRKYIRTEMSEFPHFQQDDNNYMVVFGCRLHYIGEFPRNRKQKKKCIRSEVKSKGDARICRSKNTQFPTVQHDHMRHEHMGITHHVFIIHFTLFFSSGISIWMCRFRFFFFQT